jgi:nucleoside-diphosphate kinase
MYKVLLTVLFGMVSLNLFAADAKNDKLPPHEYSLTLVKPDAVASNHVGDVVARFEKGGLCVAAARMTKLTKQQAESFYAVHKDRPFYPDLVTYMSSGPIVAIVLEGTDTVAKARAIMGATDPKKAAAGTIRADFGQSVQQNAVHGSDSIENAKKEIAFFFKPNEIYR